jgi:hypothetical protein
MFWKRAWGLGSGKAGVGSEHLEYGLKIGLNLLSMHCYYFLEVRLFMA